MADGSRVNPHLYASSSYPYRRHSHAGMDGTLGLYSYFGEGLVAVAVYFRYVRDKVYIDRRLALA